MISHWLVPSKHGARYSPPSPPMTLVSLETSPLTCPCCSASLSVPPGLCSLQMSLPLTHACWPSPSLLRGPALPLGPLTLSHTCPHITFPSCTSLSESRVQGRKKPWPSLCLLETHLTMPVPFELGPLHQPTSLHRPQALQSSLGAAPMCGGPRLPPQLPLTSSTSLPWLPEPLLRDWVFSGASAVLQSSAHPCSP